MRFGEKVRDLRKKHSLTQDELAKCLGVSKRTVIGWERDGRYPRNVEILEKMADIFHVPLTYIQPDQSLFIERAAATYGKKGKIEAQHLAFTATLDNGSQPNDLRTGATANHDLGAPVIFPFKIVFHNILLTSTSIFSYTGSKKVSGWFGLKISLQVITVTRFSVFDRLMIL